MTSTYIKGIYIKNSVKSVKNLSMLNFKEHTTANPYILDHNSYFFKRVLVAFQTMFINNKLRTVTNNINLRW